MKILVPVDFSDDALQALRYAATLAKLMQKTLSISEDPEPELLLYHAFHVPIGGDATFFVDSDMLDKAERAERHKLEQLASTIPDIHAISHRVMIQMALPGEGIIETINEEGIDLVVMGVRGVDASSAWLGSTTLHVMKHVICPVLAVPHSTEVLHPKQVAFATDLEEGENSFSLDFLVRLLKLWKASMHIIHVHSQPATIGMGKAEEALRLDHIFRDVPHTYHFPQDKVATRGISRYLNDHSVDLLVIIPRYHFALGSVFHKSVTRYLTTHPSVPLLAFHERL
uniref:Universal stress protein n=1 Tax=Roseihalotalea indica TaxID=2867963 RepID=A0AA49GJS2_9BACT|nr:universal stress protein [Tunicatimonas sp. TK19036]